MGEEHREPIPGRVWVWELPGYIWGMLKNLFWLEQQGHYRRKIVGGVRVLEG